MSKPLVLMVPSLFNSDLRGFFLYGDVASVIFTASTDATLGIMSRLRPRGLSLFWLVFSLRYIERK